jgi:hypothetical protein
MIICQLSAGSRTLRNGRGQTAGNKECKCFQNSEVRAATSLLLFDWIVSECKTHWEESRTFELKRCRDID